MTEILRLQSQSDPDVENDAPWSTLSLQNCIDGDGEMAAA